MDKNHQDKLTELFQKWSGDAVKDIEALPPSGSYREYYRIRGEKGSQAIGAYNADRKENIAFIEFSRHFFSKGCKVPEIYDTALDYDVYLLEDLGDSTLFSTLTQLRKGADYPVEIISLYEKVVERLPYFQVVAGEGIDYTKCYPRSDFDHQSMMWDLNYFKYYFLKLARIPFDEQLLEDDFQRLTNYLLSTDTHYFLYRDFQSRNIMIRDGEPHFIDYQGGRRGALQYDLASLLYDGKADMPQPFRQKLLEHYIQNLKKYTNLDENAFRSMFYGYVLIRIMQAMGSYGFRGYYERKSHFLKSIPFAIANLDWILKNVTLPIELPTLTDVFYKLVASEELKNINAAKESLAVKITSFSYKRGIPVDESGNGGGFVFDCRALVNPGKYDEYKSLNGKDKSVKDFLDEQPDTALFLNNVYALVDQSVERYQQRQFTHLMVNFGCTGGQHRSVYSAEALAKHIQRKYDVKIILRHYEEEFR